MQPHGSLHPDRSAPDAACRIAPLGVDVVVAYAAPLGPLVESQLSPWEPTPVPAHGPVDLQVFGPPTDGHDVPYQLAAGGTTIARVATAGEFRVALQDWLDAEMTRRVAGLTPVHAGVVAWHGRGLLLPGRSGAGKTTLVAALVALGAAYYSDELAFLDERGFVHPYPRHLTVRGEHGIRRAEAGTGREMRSMPPVPASLIAGLRFGPDAPFEAEPVTSSEAVLLLLANTAHRLAAATGVPHAFTRAAASARSYQGTRGEAVVAGAALLRMLADDRP